MTTIRVVANALTKLEVEIYDEQYEYIKKHFGKDAADSANYGWGVDELGNGFRVATKVYGRGTLTSRGFLGDPEITMDFEPFS